MDDLFQYLIWGIIIFSFLSSFFKKKEPPKPPLPGTKPKTSSQFPGEQQRIDYTKIAQKQDEYDILKELENMLKGDLKIPQQQPKQTSVSTEFPDHEIRDKDLETENDIRTRRNVESYKTIESNNSVEERNYIEPKGKVESRISVEQLNLNRQKTKVDSKVEENAKAFERVLAGPRKQRAAITEFNRKLKNPSTVREYILFSEILGKPKALRR